MHLYRAAHAHLNAHKSQGYFARISARPLAKVLCPYTLKRLIPDHAQVRAIVISDESVKEARIVREAREAAAHAMDFRRASECPQGFAEDVFIAQLHNRSVLLNSGFQVMSCPLPSEKRQMRVNHPKLAYVVLQSVKIQSVRISKSQRFCSCCRVYVVVKLVTGSLLSRQKSRAQLPHKTACEATSCGTASRKGPRICV